MDYFLIDDDYASYLEKDSDGSRHKELADVIKDFAYLISEEEKKIADYTFTDLKNHMTKKIDIYKKIFWLGDYAR